MTIRSHSSRRRFEEFKSEFRSTNGQAHGKHRQRRDRSSLELIRSFFVLLRGHRLSVVFSLLALSVATLLALIPPAATKFVVDYVLGGTPLPESTPAWVPPEPLSLLVTITV
ncbi:MAG: hypothetical protein ACC628_14090, partial [Pirellulaceae bacterium]